MRQGRKKTQGKENSAGYIQAFFEDYPEAARIVIFMHFK